jgi:type I restriction enzyme R subunit
LTDHLKEALSIYAADDRKDVEGSLTDITGEIPVLDARYRRLLNVFIESGVAEIEDFVQQRIKRAARNWRCWRRRFGAWKTWLSGPISRSS